MSEHGSPIAETEIIAEKEIITIHAVVGYPTLQWPTINQNNFLSILIILIQECKAYFCSRTSTIEVTQIQG